MGIAVNSSRTDSYIGTFSKENKDDMEQLDTVRKIVSNLNKDLRIAGKDYQFYVKCQGRSDTVKRSFSKYYYSLPLSVADRVDAYIYRRHTA